MAVKPSSEISPLTLSVVLKINGSVLQDQYAPLAIEVGHAFNSISYAEISFSDAALDTQNPAFGDNDIFLPGNDIEILAGYGENDITPVFMGVIVKQGIEVSAEIASTFRLSCKQRAVRMSFSSRNTEFAGLADSSIVSKVIEKNGLKASVTETAFKLETLHQRRMTDWDFICSSASALGFLVSCEGGDEVRVAPPDLAGEPVLRLVMGQSIFSFTAELDAGLQAPGIKAAAWEIGALATVNEIAEETGLNLRLFAMKGKVSFQGGSLVSLGKLIELDGVGKHYNGQAFVSSVTHSISGGNWLTNVGFGLDISDFVHGTHVNVEPAAEPKGINGLQLATVMKLHEDPSSLYRIQLRLNSGVEVQQGTWARVSNFDATASAGARFLPEVGDEVVVGFFDGDPAHPVVLGSLYSPSKKPYAEADDVNNSVKSIVTRAQLEISFDDKEKVITIRTPGGNSLRLDDGNKKTEIRDQHGNVISTGTEGIEILSVKDLHLSAKGSIKIDAGVNVMLNADADIDIDALNIRQQAAMGLRASGNASAELSSSGQMVLKGALININ